MKYFIYELIHIRSDMNLRAILSPGEMRFLHEIVSTHYCLMDAHHNVWTLSHGPRGNVDNIHQFLKLNWKLDPVEISKYDIDGNQKIQKLIKPGYELKEMIDFNQIKKEINMERQKKLLNYYKEHHKLIDSIIDESKKNNSIIKISSAIKNIKNK